MPGARTAWLRPRVLVLLAVALFVAGTVAPPLLELSGRHAGGWLRLCYGPLCHQEAARSLTLSGQALAVCARCAGLYAGGLAGLALGLALAARRRWPTSRWFWALVLPTVADAGLGILGLPALANGPRFLLALPAGVIVGVKLMQALDDWFTVRRYR